MYILLSHIPIYTHRFLHVFTLYSYSYNMRTQVIQLPTCASLYHPPPPTSPSPSPAGNPPKINGTVQQLHLLPAIYQRNIYYQNELLICLSRILTTTLTQTYTAYNTTLTPTSTPTPQSTSTADSTAAIQSSSTSTSSVKPSASYTASDVTQWQMVIDSYCRYLALLYHYYYTSANNNNINISSNNRTNTTNSNNRCGSNSNSIASSDGPKPDNSVLLVQSGTVILSIVSFLMNAVSCDISIQYNTLTTIHTNNTNNSSSSDSNRVVSYNDLDTIVNHVLSLLINDNNISLSDVKSTQITINRYNSSVLLLVFSSMSVWENNASFCHNSDVFEKVSCTHVRHCIYVEYWNVYMYCTH